MYAESVGVPLILSGPDIESNKVIDTAVNHIDIFPTILDSTGCSKPIGLASSRAQSLLRPLDPERITFSEYHAIGSTSAVYMIQNSRRKYVFYCDHTAEFFDLVNDPEEMNNLASDPNYKEEIESWHQTLNRICNPFDTDARAKKKQQDLIDFYGGRQAILDAKGIGGYSPPPTQLPY